MDNNRESSPAPIAVFDSGYGGLTVLKSLQNLMPNYSFVYLGDNARAPYGTRSFDIVYEYTLQAVKQLFSMGVNLIILACNTASAKALRTIQQVYLPTIEPNKRVLGVIRPTVEYVSKTSVSNNIGVLGTVGTVQSESYLLELKKQNASLNVYQQSCPMWVPLVENDEHMGEGADYFVSKYINELFTNCNSIDSVILACTHYPLLLDKIKSFVGDDVSILSQGDIVANSLLDYLQRHPDMDLLCEKKSHNRYFTTEGVAKFNKQAELFLGKKVQSEYIHLL